MDLRVETMEAVIAGNFSYHNLHKTVSSETVFYCVKSIETKNCKIGKIDMI